MTFHNLRLQRIKEGLIFFKLRFQPREPAIKTLPAIPELHPDFQIINNNTQITDHAQHIDNTVVGHFVGGQCETILANATLVVRMVLENIIKSFHFIQPFHEAIPRTFNQEKKHIMLEIAKKIMLRISQH